MKALIINNTIIAKFQQVPKFLKQFRHIQRPDLLNVAELAERGIKIVEVDEPVYNSEIQQLENERYDEGLNKVIFDVSEIDLPTLAEAKLQKIAELKGLIKDLYQSVQAYITEKQIYGENIPAAARNKIQSIRTKSEELKAEINVLTTVVDVVKYKLPYTAIENLKSQLEAIE